MTTLFAVQAIEPIGAYGFVVSIVNLFVVMIGYPIATKVLVLSSRSREAVESIIERFIIWNLVNLMIIIPLLALIVGLSFPETSD